MIVGREKVNDDIFIIFQVEKDEIPMAIDTLEALWRYAGEPDWLRKNIDDFKANHPWVKTLPDKEM